MNAPNNFANHRISALPITQYCAKASDMSGPYAGTSARLSTAFHKMASNDPDWRNHIDRLSDADEAEVKSWKMPAEVKVGDITLRYKDAEKEVPMGLDAELRYCPPYSAESVTRGTMDHGWVVDVDAFERWAYVVDLKRSEWTVIDGPKSLQLAGYGFGYAGKVGADVFVPGIWAATEGTYWWGEPVRLKTPEAERLGRRVLAAALNLPSKDNQYTMGAHCTGCYGRERCPAYLLPPEYATSTLAPLTPDRIEKPMTPEEALSLLILCERAEDTIKVAKAAVRERVHRGLKVIDPKTGMQWAAVQCRGRTFEYHDKEAAKADGVDLEKYKREGRGKPFEQYRWLKP